MSEPASPDRSSTPAETAESFLESRLASFGYALTGLLFVLRTQHNAWIHLTFAAFAVIAGIVVGLSRLDWLWVSSAIALVWFAEAMNTAFEILSDVIEPHRSIRIKVAKDIAAGAVLICSLYAIVVGLLVFGRRLFG